MSLIHRPFGRHFSPLDSFDARYNQENTWPTVLTSSLTWFAAYSLIRLYKLVSVQSSWRWRATAWWSPGVTRKPFLPSSTCNGIPPARVAITGLPLWSASETLTSKPSRVESWSAILALERRALRSWSEGPNRMTEMECLRDESADSMNSITASYTRDPSGSSTEPCPQMRSFGGTVSGWVSCRRLWNRAYDFKTSNIPLDGSKRAIWTI